MNFDFSEEQRSLQEQLRDYLAEASPLTVARKALEEKRGIDADLWGSMSELGWLGIRIPEEFGGSGLDILTLLLAAEEAGRVIAPVPFGTSICGVAETLIADGSAEAKAAWLPKLATGEAIGVLAMTEKAGRFDPANLETRFEGGKVSGTKIAVADGGSAHVALVACKGDNGAQLVLVDLDQPGVTRTAVESIDPSRSAATLQFDNAAGEVVGGANALDAALLRAAVACAFEQIGGADATLAMTLEYMNLRQAFGKPISSYQGLKHRMAEVYTAIELARAHAYYAAWALYTGSPELGEAAASARVAAGQAFQLAATEAIQMHGGIGFTWESDCHLFYRRSKFLSAWLGGPDMWRERLIAELETQAA